jgi:hypothetical protein
MRAAVIAVLLPLLASVPLQAQNSCRPVGVWELVSGKADTASYPAAMHQVKIITRTHWVFIARYDSIIREMKTAADSLQVFRTSGAGGGTYTLQGTTYTEKIDFFSDPAYIGMSLPYTCRTEGDRFIQTGTFPEQQGGKTVHTWRLEEVYRRIE